MGERIHSSWLATAAWTCTLLVACASPTASSTATNAAAKRVTYSCMPSSPDTAPARNQAQDGSYSDGSYSGSNESSNERRSDIETTCLMTLSLLGDGSTMRAGFYKTQIKNAIRWLRHAQQPDGTIGATAGTASNNNMVEHGLATYTLVEAAGLSDYRLLWNCAKPAMKALLAHRNDDGGWSSDQDQSEALATAWCALACMSARHFGQATPEQPSNQDLMVWFDRHPATTAEHAACELLCRSVAGQTSPDLVHRVLAEATVTDPDECYWASTALYVLGGPSWKTWQAKMADIDSMRITDIENEHFGCYPPAGRRGLITTTALRALSLVAYYRYSRLIRLNREQTPR